MDDLLRVDESVHDRPVAKNLTASKQHACIRVTHELHQDGLSCMQDRKDMWRDHLYKPCLAMGMLMVPVNGLAA